MADNLARVRLFTSGTISTRPASTGVRLLVISSADVCDWVAIVTVKFAAEPFVNVRLDGLKLHEAFAGRLLQLNETVPA